MAVRALRRTNPITLVLAFALAVGFLLFVFSPGSTRAVSAAQRQHDAAQNPLSPPTKPFRKKQLFRSNGLRVPPPVVNYNLNNVTTTGDSAERHERVLVLTPLARFYPQYWDNLLRLSYPHEYISLGFIIPKTKDGNTATADLQKAITKTQSGPLDSRFASITILRQDFEPPIASQDEKERHKFAHQKARREAMARARNSLLFTTLGPATSWVLWLDADVVESPPTLIQDLTRHNKPVVVPNCYQRYLNADSKLMDTRPYDYNSWVDTDRSLEIAGRMGPDEIMLEGYAELPTYRTLMAHLADRSPNRDANNIMELHGVGGTALLVKAEVHRDGAMFPPFPFYHLVETEGFAKMARRLGHKCYGLPNYFVYHYNE
ncbi:Golgi mannosyltransferase complex subunit [Ophidiomyces ophidiicola]|uniref:Golgi mannosyltransferase complex subunit n=1 Tax=Ophidiomyces ophidiicola TaxID=1387563 RepID=A0ACB8UY77_9EURO|nr:Golgi mannosyltransferase complex subunit [Ophidiomyces ophidiicola]KAI1909263.1 Golgi mannosyltransferase complex subunit [Ophidiomyces ophidiicola]KAI1912050.1 Golgi mannosyltransferase complex subunit [Ophidiomyces ophidiicola]KAI1927721.1 Golgi mannosyltransferase complex subunit [Ophidiomyces ophidiicola]KAI1934864.1 Golgi mannosyltransferase complex subunit [Ophidiomyces ophidiicola]KAI1948564.1 Golgi mannosyltransferase complex subunit [Ophidiomyces ophidiicola]